MERIGGSPLLCVQENMAEAMERQAAIAGKRKAKASR
jgi:hypothetical protein